MNPLERLESTTVVLDNDHVDTDQIVPARFLTTIARDDLAEAAFADWRFDRDGRPRADCSLNTITETGAEILVAGDNFGCGSSREHAVWALQQLGLRAVLSPRLADIFRTNALKNGLLAVEIDTDTHRWLVRHPGARITADVTQRRIVLPDGRHAAFELDDFSRHCLLEGVDALGFLLGQSDAIQSFEQGRGAN